MTLTWPRSKIDLNMSHNLWTSLNYFSNWCGVVGGNKIKFRKSKSKNGFKLFFSIFWTKRELYKNRTLEFKIEIIARNETNNKPYRIVYISHYHRTWSEFWDVFGQVFERFGFNLPKSGACSSSRSLSFIRGLISKVNTPRFIVVKWSISCSARPGPLAWNINVNIWRVCNKNNDCNIKI